MTLVHPRDSRLAFEGSTHTYSWDGRRVPISVTGLWEKHFPAFDAALTIGTYYEGWMRNPTSKYHALCHYLALVHGAVGMHVLAAAVPLAVLELTLEHVAIGPSEPAAALRDAVLEIAHVGPAVGQR